MQKNDFLWSPEQQQAFEQIKQEVICAVALGPVQTRQDVKNMLYSAAGEKGVTRVSGKEHQVRSKVDL